MTIFSGQWSSDHLKVTGAVLTSVLLSACGGASVGSSSSYSSSNNSSSSIASVDHCLDGFQPHNTNGHIADGPAEFTANGSTDLTVQPTVYNYMYENGWQDAHVLWHQARICGGFGGAFGINGLPSACNFTDLLPAQNDCQGPQNGLEFFAAHRLMMEQLMELWPDHKAQFTGWGTFPRTINDYAPQLRGDFTPWSQTILQNADIADNIENNLDMFPTEGELGTWIQCAIMPGQPANADFSTARNLHFALHNNGVSRTNQKHAVNNNNNNIDSYSFWRLHGWIDNIWEKYRIAKGKTRNDADYKATMLAQCREMDRWREIAVDARGDGGHPNQDQDFVPVLVESGFFNDVLRPAFDDAGCSTCHGAGEQAGLRLGYEISSTEIVERLINRNSSYAQGYKMVVPGKPEESWLYLKASGKSTTSGVTCQGFAQCSRQMTGLSDEAIENIRLWILNGAEAPIILN